MSKEKRNGFKQKLKSALGMTMSELLVATIIIGLVTAGLATAVTQASANYEKSKRQSEAKMLCSSLESIICDQLRYTNRLHQDGAGVLSFQSADYGSESSLGTFSVEQSTKKIFTIDGETNDYGIIVLAYSDGTENKILADGSYNLGMMASVTAMTYDETSHVFSVTIAVVNEQGNLLVKDSFSVENLKEVTPS